MKYPEFQLSFQDVKRVKMEPTSSTATMTAAEAAPTSNCNDNGVDLSLNSNRESQHHRVQQRYLQQQHLQQQQQPSVRRQQTLSEYVLASLTNYGLCVLDNFMGHVKASQILEDVQQMDESDVLKSGKTVQKDDEVKNVRKVRHDRIAFITKGKSQGIDDLVYKLDNLITNVQIKSKLDDPNNKLIDISGRTRAMVSCYPGNGTHYACHVDNHHKDGRCITVVYYLNKDWDSKVHGGLLKVYPKQVHPRVAKIVPNFDRALVFWSDERNPHEVLPAFRSRYAVTVWYFDRKERQKALEKHQSLGNASSTS